MHVLFVRNFNSVLEYLGQQEIQLRKFFCRFPLVETLNLQMKKGKKVDTEMKKFEEGNKAFSILYRWSFWTVTSGILMLKCLLIPSYHSTDFEVHICLRLLKCSSFSF